MTSSWPGFPDILTKKAPKISLRGFFYETIYGLGVAAGDHYRTGVGYYILSLVFFFAAVGLVIPGAISLAKTIRHNVAANRAVPAKPAPEEKPAAAAVSDSSIETLKKLKELYDAGILSEEEFTEKKKQMLNI